MILLGKQFKWVCGGAARTRLDKARTAGHLLPAEDLRRVLSGGCDLGFGLHRKVKNK